MGKKSKKSEGYNNNNKKKKQDKRFPEILNRIWRWRAWAVTHIYLYAEVCGGPTLICEGQDGEFIRFVMHWNRNC